MRFTLGPVIFFLIVEFCCALPVIKNHEESIKNEKNEVDVEDHGVNSQQNGDKFDPNNPHMRTKWDEDRRRKLELLKQFYNRLRELESGEDLNPFKHHDDEMEPKKIHAVKIMEVKRSINKLTEELMEIDHNRRELFKEYEMQKKFNEHQKEMGNELSEEKRIQYHEEQEKLKEKHKKHEPLHHPGSKQQLEEVWEKQDHVNQEFDPEAFFTLHDMDGNGVWDQNEVKSLFQIELDKMYQDGVPEDDLIERYEEMERMREHVFKEADIDKNGFIDYHEFLKQTQKPEFQKDDGWKGLDEQQIYTQEDYDNYMRQHSQQQQQAAQANAHANGLPPQQPHGVNYQQQPPPQHGDPNFQYQQGQVPNHVQYQNQIPQYQQPQGHQQIPVQNQQHVPIHQQQQPLPQYQQHQVPQQQQQYQMPPQHVTRDQIPPEQQYQHHVGQQQQQNIPNQLNIQHQQQQQVNNGHLNAQVPPAVQNTQNQAPAQQQPQQQQQQQQQHIPNNVEQKNAHAAPAVVSKVDHV